MSALDNYKQRSLGVFYESLTPQDEELIEHERAKRASRLAELIQSDVWKLDIVPILTKLHDDYLQAVKQKEIDPDALKVFDEILNSLNGSIQIGAGAMQRLAKRRLNAETNIKKLQERV